RLRELHARVLEALEREYPDRLGEQVDRLAHHAVRGEVWPRALAYLRRAGSRAAARSAYREAVACFEQALVAVAHLPDGRDAAIQAIDVLLEQQGSLAALGRTRQREECLRRAKDLALTLEDRSRLGRVLAMECIDLRAAHELDRAEDAGERALAIASD